MLFGLAVFTLMLTALDHWSTYLCLRAPVEGWLVTEANPLAAWVFERVGLIPGLAIDSLITFATVAFLLRTSLFPRVAKFTCLLMLIGTTAYAVSNNLGAIVSLGISPLGSN